VLAVEFSASPLCVICFSLSVSITLIFSRCRLVLVCSIMSPQGRTQFFSLLPLPFLVDTTMVFRFPCAPIFFNTTFS